MELNISSLVSPRRNFQKLTGYIRQFRYLFSIYDKRKKNQVSQKKRPARSKGGVPRPNKSSGAWRRILKIKSAREFTGSGGGANNHSARAHMRHYFDLTVCSFPKRRNRPKSLHMATAVSVFGGVFHIVKISTPRSEISPFGVHPDLKRPGYSNRRTTRCAKIHPPPQNTATRHNATKQI